LRVIIHFAWEAGTVFRVCKLCDSWNSPSYLRQDTLLTSSNDLNESPDGTSTQLMQ
jgi:hypothetical protein